jgi:hypothetical protein
MKEKLEQIKKAWKNDYFAKLGIYKHLIECKQKFDAVENHSISNMSKEELQKELDKELADLKILLDIYVKEETFQQRINKFLENIKEENQA